MDRLKSRSQPLHRTQKRPLQHHRKNYQTGKLLPIQLALIVKGTLFLGYLPIFFLLYAIPVDFLRQKTARLMLGLFGVYEIEDFAIDDINDANIYNGAAKAILFYFTPH